MKRGDTDTQKLIEKRQDSRLILVGAEDPLPSQHFWFEGNGYWIYTASSPAAPGANTPMTVLRSPSASSQPTSNPSGVPLPKLPVTAN